MAFAEAEVVEEFGIQGALALAAEVFGGFHQAASEQTLPEAIDGDACGERMIRCGKPLRVAMAVLRCVFGEGREEGGGDWADFFGAFVILAARQDVGLLGLRQFLHDHNFFLRFGQGGDFGAGGLKFGKEGR